MPHHVAAELYKDKPVGTDWNEILEQIDKSTVPTQLVRQIIFHYDDEQNPVSIWLDEFDAETLATMGPLLSPKKDSRYRIELVVDTDRMQRMITNLISPILSLVPSSNKSR